LDVFLAFILPPSSFDSMTHKLSIKFFAAPATAALPDHAAVPVFHHWIQQKSFPNHLLIDVADYAHVPNGPGTLLVAHEANIHFDREDGTGVLYVRKQPDGKTFEQNLRATLRGALTAAAKLEEDPSLNGARFDTKRLQFRIHDRLAAPNTPETFEAIKPDLEHVLGSAYGSPVKLSYVPDAERLFQVDVEAGASPDAKTLLARV
jgi:hypothetical protein